jgi:peptide-methionine (R)-S-oxide reductase
MSDMKSMPDDYWKKKLTPEQYHVLREGGTETPFTGKFEANEEDGMYTCAACGAKLFSSENKFHSGSGWPSFDRAVDDKTVELLEDDSHGMHRVEVRCANCGSHLGHVFDDGPQDTTGQRFCINSCSLGFEKKK